MITKIMVDQYNIIILLNYYYIVTYSRESQRYILTLANTVIFNHNS